MPFAVSAKAGRTTAPLLSALGLASYALYAVHIPLLNATRAVLFALHVSPNPHFAGFVFLAAILPGCILLDWVTSPASVRPSASAPASAAEDPAALRAIDRRDG